MADLDGGGVAHPPTVQPQAAQGQADEGMNRVPVLDVEECPAPAEDLGGVIGFDAEPLLQVNPPDPFFQPFKFHSFPVHDHAA